MTDTVNHQVLIVGGGAAGIAVAASLKRRAKNADIAIIEPSEDHYYQPAFTLVGAGCYELENTRRPEHGLVPKGVKWIRGEARSFDPDNNKVILKSGDEVTYDYLVVCPGLALEWDRVEGLEEALGKYGVCSNYSLGHVEYTWECLQKMKEGARLLFTQPPMPIKCPGAPQKIAYLAADYLKRHGLGGKCDLHFMTQTPAVFGVPYFARALEKVMARYGIHTHYQTNLVAVDAPARKAVFEDADGKKHEYEFDMLHVTPPQGAPAFIKESPFAGEGGWVDVNHHTLQHKKYENVFSLGDVCSTPNSKTAAAIRKQSPVVVRNIMNMIAGKNVEEGYDGYASCPLTTAKGKVMLAEFVYGGKVTPTFPLNPAKEYGLYWWVKVTGLPVMYWSYMLKGYEWFFRHNRDFQEESGLPPAVNQDKKPEESLDTKKAA